MLRQDFLTRLRNRLEFLYPSQVEDVVQLLTKTMEKYQRLLPAPTPMPWSERDTVLITYADQIRTSEESPLSTLRRFLSERQLTPFLNTVHLLPFYPYSSDDGFSVIDYRQVKSESGDWDDVNRLSESVHLMYDLVLNHVSSESDYFQHYCRGREPFVRFFIEADPQADVSQVTRPRSSALLTEVSTNRGPRWVWTTFSADQVDLNFAEPLVLNEMIDVLLFYVQHRARIVRLDAIAYLWKELGTPCIHLPQTHEVVKLMRDILEEIAPHVWILTETNVPHRENVSYFGQGDEAQMVYQFSLPPLLCDAILQADATILAQWLGSLEFYPNTTYFNFTASHDGIGVRPLEGLVPPERLQALVDAALQRGGKVSMKRNSDGTESPYELNITYVDAVASVAGEPPETHAQRFLCSQAVMLALRGIPGIYFHSLVGTQNDYAGSEASGHARSINRHKYQLNELNSALENRESLQSMIFLGYRNLLAVRTKQPAFHPDGDQQVLPCPTDRVLAFQRTSPDKAQRIYVVANFSPRSQEVETRKLASGGSLLDLISGQVLSETIRLQPFQVVWAEVQEGQ